MKNIRSIAIRDKPNDVFFTPDAVVDIHIGMIEHKPEDIWYDPFRGQGAYYNKFPTENKIYTEITEGLDFFEFTGRVDIIASNPPFSKFDNIIKKCIELNPRIIALIMGAVNFTPKRIDTLKNAGYGITKIHILKVRGWLYNPFLCVFEKDKPSIISHTMSEFKNPNYTEPTYKKTN